MSQPSLAAHVHVAVWALVLTSNWTVAELSIIQQTPGDVPLCLAPSSPAKPKGGLLIGYASGRVLRKTFVEGKAHTTWEAKVDGGVLSMLESSSSTQADHGLVVGTTTGAVVCFRGEVRAPAWRFESTCEVSCLAELSDVDGDGASEIVVGGADHRVHLLSGKAGTALWSHLFESEQGDGYVMRLLAMPDQDSDQIPEITVWLWSGELAVLSGKSGNERWRKKIGEGFTDALAALPDLNGDGMADCVVGGNDNMVRACSGLDGAVLWSGGLARPIRDITVDASRAKKATVYACTSGGEIARFEMDGPAIGATAHWTANLGDVCRSIMLTADLDGDGALDVAASAENGAVAVISGRSGRVLTRCQVGDVVRALCPLVVNGQPQVAMASLDEAAYLLSAGDPARGVPPKVATRPAAITRPVPARRSFEAAPDPRVIILLYHDVLPEARYHYATSLANFRAQMDMLVREEYACVSLDEIADWIEGKGNLPERAVCITFDGPYQGQYLHALPILRERGFFGTLYITTDWIGTANHPDWHELRVMDAAGIMDVQNHTINHPYLSKQDRAGIRTQLERCDEAIERHLSRRISRHHAYPAGAHNEQVRKITRELGFRTATTVRPGPVGRHDDLMSLPRYMVCTHRTLEQFQAWLTGADAPSSANSQPASVR